MFGLVSMSILRLVKFGGKIETFRANGQELLKELIAHARNCDIAVIEKPEDDLRFVVADKEVRLALEIKARTSPELVEGKFVTYLVNRTTKNEEVQPVGKTWSFGENGEVVGSSRGRFPSDFVRHLMQSLSVEQADFRTVKSGNGHSAISAHSLGASVLSLLMSGEWDIFMRAAVAV